MQSIKTIKTIFLLFFITLFLSSCEQKNDGNQKAQNPIEVGYINPKKEPINLEIELIGKVKAKELALVRPQVSGIIEKQLFKEGSFVKQGDILYKIDSATYKATLNQSLALLNSAKASLISAEAKSKRAEELLKFDGISKQEADEIKASYLQAKALVEQRAAELENTKIDLNRSEIKAPISGYIGISNVTVGALVNANQSEELVNIRDTQTVFVDLSQSYNEILNLKSIGDLEDDIEVSLKFDNGFEYPIKGKLEARELSVDESSQTVTLRAVFNNPNNLLLSGMMTKAILKSKKSIDGFLIPQQAVLRDQKANPIVTLVTPENKTITKIVKIERSVGNKWLILDVLEESDKIVVEGLNKINSRSVVSLKDLNSQYKD
ncbi:efflux RND transporter periplasmic adaptor subunit [Aliarcobacter cryaerophilus]|uniref:Efflux RND transporter periplasmic adaptor subunit n=2 Tax=unclassified Arcobacter TaxID=2593671 RepID=A0AA96DCZ4_9BACT|nr:efflux RND transporter periplasmic adaptor subunit [Arcobacter sp. AZ-2023]WPD08985.1 efflux RND transporter periplasmic adaptor subunit [Arcobacter sp. DSM 115954]WNL13817.1 efflux RND transporter periplasmic adaptor subunit [Arcobacter sp. AZ-2023]WNL18177.1 efflux RND transporter periplasmic adaptor subunit [Arcobacter sp. AZ-2023]WNL20312.1 efflux RND transporter periplasmic adaptor subunit [Arcobacter sp. AZ-2023]